jgi:F-type H+-transporting ATPase subunit a
MVIELVAGIAIGFGIGYGLDALFDTLPVFLVIFVLLGFAAGVKTMLRTAQEVQGQETAKAEEDKEGGTVASEAQSEGSGLVFHPMDQFIVKPLFGDGPIEWYTITNVTLWMALSVVAIIALLVVGTARRAIVPSRSQSIGELAYGFVYKMVEDVAGKDAVGYFPYIMTLFMFIVCANFLGLLPMSFTTTSHIAVTAVMAMGVFLAVTILGFVKHGMSFLSLFWISSAPLVLRPILALIEVISYFVRPVSHSIRLAGNMMAGHAVIKVFAAFAGIAVIAPLSVIAITAIYALEVLVSFIQAYVFAILTCVYLKDALHPHH